MSNLVAARRAVTVHEVAPARFIAYLPGPHGSARTAGCASSAATTRRTPTRRVRTIEAAVRRDPRPGRPGDAGRVRRRAVSPPSTSRPRPLGRLRRRPGRHRRRARRTGAAGPRAAPGCCRWRTAPTRSRCFGSLVNAGADNRLTVVFDGGEADGTASYVAGGRAADAATHPQLRDELARMRELGYLA